MAYRQVDLIFTDGFHGLLSAEKGQARVGEEEGELSPYELLQAALGGCYYKTFLDILAKQNIEFTEARLEIRGVNRTKPPTTLEKLDIIMTIVGAASEAEKKIRRAADLAGKYCSIYQTLTHVADVRHEIILA